MTTAAMTPPFPPLLDITAFEADVTTRKAEQILKLGGQKKRQIKKSKTNQC